MKSNKFKIVSVLICVFLFFSKCDESKLDLKPLAETEEDIFDEEIDFTRSAYGLYAKMTDIYWFNSNNPKQRMWHLPGDDITTIGQTPFESFAGLQPGTGELGGYWTANYQIISRANILLQKIEDDKDKEASAYSNTSLRDNHEGEALFMRAYAYFNLYNFFGSAPPLITERIQSSEEITPPSSTGTEIIDQVITDLQAASGLLPSEWPEDDRGRVTSNSAYGLLGKALVFRGTMEGSAADLSAAITAIDNISGKSLVADYSDNFSVFNENNDESLFEFQASQPNFDNVWLSNDFDQAVGSMSAYWGYFEGHWSLFGKSRFTATDKFINAVDPDDPRVLYAVDSLNSDHITKYLREDQKSQSGVSSVNNPRILRYADVLLLKAEAILGSGGSTTEAVGLINEVRTRARNWGGGASPADRDVNETDPNTIAQWIMEERMIELFGEEAHRWWDLRRWHMAGVIDLGSWDFSSKSSNFSFNSGVHINFPVPTNEVNLNPDITQNPGY